MKKILSIFMVLLLIVGCSSPKPTTDGDSDEKVIEVVGKGHSEGLELKVTFKDNKITNVEVVNHQETDGVSDAAMEEIPKLIVEHNSVKIDAIAGATETSDGIINAVIEAIEKAGLKVDDFMKETGSKTEGKDVEYETDVVVLGGGIAGVAAAVEAQENGADVILLEKMPVTGGSTAMSGGLILAAESSISKKLGNTDTWQELADYWYKVSEEKADKEYIELAAKMSGENIDWMIENGVDMKEELTKLHSSHEFEFGHRTAGYDDVPAGGGAGFTKPLTEKIKENGGQVLTQTPALELIVEDGVVTGVKATNNNGDNITIKAKAVVIATGGYAASAEMMNEYSPYVKGADQVHGGNTGNTGDGITMGKQVDAQMEFNNSSITLSLNTPTYYGYGEGFTGLYVLPNGERFINETEFHFVRSRALMEMDINDIWAISVNGTDAEKAAVEAGTAFEASSIEELAELTDMDVETLKATIEKYNQAAEAGVDEEFGKDAQYLTKIEGDTYYALKMFMGNSGTIGGLVTTIDGEVLNNSGEVVKGLFAAGEVANAKLYYRGYPGSGTAIALYLAFGRVAGKAAAESVK